MEIVKCVRVCICNEHGKVLFWSFFCLISLQVFVDLYQIEVFFEMRSI